MKSYEVIILDYEQGTTTVKQIETHTPSLIESFIESQYGDNIDYMIVDEVDVDYEQGVAILTP